VESAPVTVTVPEEPELNPISLPVLVTVPPLSDDECACGGIADGQGIGRVVSQGVGHKFRRRWLENGDKCEISAEARLGNERAERHSLGKPKPPKLRTRNKGRFFPRFPWQYSMEKVFPHRCLARGSSTSERLLHYCGPAKAKPHLLL
jgi:hypothetical protein